MHLIAERLSQVQTVVEPISSKVASLVSVIHYVVGVLCSAGNDTVVCLLLVVDV
jgi:hypothetical protein